MNFKSKHTSTTSNNSSSIGTGSSSRNKEDEDAHATTDATTDDAVVADEFDLVLVALQVCLELAC